MIEGVSGGDAAADGSACQRYGSDGNNLVLDVHEVPSVVGVHISFVRYRTEYRSRLLKDPCGELKGSVAFVSVR